MSPTLQFPATSPAMSRYVVALTLALAAGCRAEPAVTGQGTSASKVSQVRGADDLSQGLDSLRKMAGGGGQQAMARSIYYLNQWLNGGRNVEGTWEPDRMVQSIPRALKNSPGLNGVSSFEFSEDDPNELFDKLRKEFGKGPPDRGRIDALIAANRRDLQYLQQSLWLHDVASRVRREPPPAPLAPWLKEIEQTVGLSEAEQLAAAERLFDWTTRNIQLEPLPPLPSAPAAAAGEGTDPISPAMLGQPGPGYGHVPIQLLLQGRGDAQERGRLFLLLCRQAGIEAVMLGRVDEKVSSAPLPWVAAVLAGKELYLFDPALGLPLPGPGRKGIATLSHVLADPAVLKQLDVPGGPAYPIAAGDLTNIVALIEAQPESLSRRFLLLEKDLPSARRMALAASPSGLEPRLRKCQGISTVSLWRVPFEALLYDIGRRIAMQAAAESQIRFVHEESIFHENDSPLMLGRNLHLQGQFEAHDSLPGARSYYLEARVPDDIRERLYTSEEFRKITGRTLPVQDEKQKKMLLEAEYARMQLAKQHASYWMGLTYYEAGKYAAAIEWLDLRTLQAPLPTPLAPSARYNLARAYEALGQNDKAIALLRADDSAQRHGNLLRAAWLESEPAVAADAKQ